MIRSVPHLIRHLRDVHVGDTAPSAPLTHHWWVDTSDDPWLLKVWDAGEEAWETVGAEGGGGGSGESLRGTASIDHPDTHADVAHGIGETPDRGEIMITPANDLGDAAKWWLSDLGGSTFRLNLDQPPGDGNSAEFDWRYTPADLAVPPTYDEVVKSDDPLAYWRLAETSGSTVADEVGSNDGTVQGSVDLDVDFGLPALASGAYWPSQNVSDRIDVPPLIGTHFSMEAWVRTTSEGENDTVYGEGSSSHSDRYAVIAVREGYAAFNIRRGSFQPTDSNVYIADDQPHHLVLTVADGSAILYVDGELAVADSRPLSDYNGGRMGALVRSTIADPFEGLMTEVAVYGHVLSESRVKAHYEAGMLGA